jgi:hypothetical protein
LRFEITKGKNDWKYEFTIIYGNQRLIRFKLYDKTAERFTSKGVKNRSIVDSFSTLVLTNDSKENNANSILYIFLYVIF